MLKNRYNDFSLISVGLITEGASESWRDQPVQVRPG
jgi:hypothetical protein